MWSSTRGLALFALSTFAGAAMAQDESEATKTAITLVEVSECPEAFKRVPFELSLLYHGPREIYNPFYTVFEPSAFFNFSAWDGAAPIWTREGYLDDHPFFYVDRKNDPTQKFLVELKPYTWFKAECIVRSGAQGHAWIEVLAITDRGGALDLTDMRHLVRAHVRASTGEWQAALLECEMARLLNAPPGFVARCRAEEGRVALAAGDPDRAVVALEQAWKCFPSNREIAGLLNQATERCAAARVGQTASAPRRDTIPPEPLPTPTEPAPEQPAPTQPSEPEPTPQANPTEEPAAPPENSAETTTSEPSETGEPTANPETEPANPAATPDETQPKSEENATIEPGDASKPELPADAQSDDGTPTPDDMEEAGSADEETTPVVEDDGSDAPSDDGSDEPKDGAKPKDDGAKPKADGTKPVDGGDKPKDEGDKPKDEGSKPKDDGSKPKVDAAKPKEEGAKPKVEVSKPKDPSTGKPSDDGSKPKDDGSKPKDNGSGGPKSGG